MHNKSKRLIPCKKCERKRYCSRVPIPNHNWRYTCSQGHTWVIEGVTAERVTAILDKHFRASMKSIFDKENAFYFHMRKK